MESFLVFNLYGAMASWGDIAVGEQRGSAGHPGKSAILGLLAAALGVRRDEEAAHQTLHQDLGFAVRVDQVGALLRDYHTTQAPAQRKGQTFHTRYDEMQAEKLNTILSQRDYRTDASWTVVLWLKTSTPKWTLAELRDALLRPRFTLYLGRKSCPLALPLQPQIMEAATLYQVFEQAVPQQMLYQYFDPATVSIYWEDISKQKSGFPAELKSLQMTSSRRDELLSRNRWQFAERVEHYISLPAKGGHE